MRTHNHDIHEVAFQCDGDLEGFLKTAGLKRLHKGDAYMLSDTLAWANNRRWEPDGAVFRNISEDLKDDLKVRLR